MTSCAPLNFNLFINRCTWSHYLISYYLCLYLVVEYLLRFGSLLCVFPLSAKTAFSTIQSCPIYMRHNLHDLKNWYRLKFLGKGGRIYVNWQQFVLVTASLILKYWAYYYYDTYNHLTNWWLSLICLEKSVHIFAALKETPAYSVKYVLY